ncbi:hypothetical protein [Acinetobacter baumannii]|uniref:hypothetical protein n=1 Tax=Acinetobacter baumannii TaxID=470 RepID=UPI00112C9C93|nr:hypothetical protein [Acinetobacter baumannii]TPS75543.1 hypothetical protein FJU45_05110 [Acinetobacter baumannii]
MNLLGNASVFIDCIGRTVPDKKILDAVSIVAADFNISETNFDSEKTLYWEFFKRGVTFQFDENETLKVVFIYIKDNEQYFKYPFLDDFILGVNYESSKTDIEKILGIAEKKGQKWVKYRLANKYLHFEFGDDEKLNLITIGGVKD